MSYLSRLLAVILFLVLSLPVLRATPGANVPWTTSEAENMTINGGTVIGPPTQVASLNAVVWNTIQMEASGGQAVALTGTGQYVEFTARSNANAIVVRYCVPDTADGTGTNSTISLYLNTNFVQKLPVTSQTSWRYGAYPFSNNPGSGLPRNFFDEVRRIGLTINAGDKVGLEKDADDTATNDVIDLVDLEPVAPPLAAPPNSLCLTNSPYNADPTGVSDSTTALRNCINDARAQLKTVWMPAGTYVITGTITNPSSTTVQGAGMWYTTLLGNASLYNTTPSRRITLLGNGNYIHLSDFAITGFLNYRNDSEPNDGLGGVPTASGQPSRESGWSIPRLASGSSTQAASWFLIAGSAIPRRMALISIRGCKRLWSRIALPGAQVMTVLPSGRRVPAHLPPAST